MATCQGFFGTGQSQLWVGDLVLLEHPWWLENWKIGVWKCTIRGISFADMVTNADLHVHEGLDFEKPSRRDVKDMLCGCFH